MNIDSKPPIILRVLQFPLIRLVLLGGTLFLLMGISNGFMQAYADAPLIALAAVAGMVAVGFAVYIGFVHFVERRPVKELALPGVGREFGSGLLLGAGLYTACVLILMLFGIYRAEGLDAWYVLLPVLPMAISSAVMEELIHRGVVFRILEEYLGSWIALAVASLVFGLRHLSNPDGTLQGALFISVEAGVLLTAAFMLTRRLWLAIGFHMAWNYTQAGIFSGAVSGTGPERGLVIARIEGPELLTGGSFGLEASLIAFLLCTTAGVLLLVMTVRRGTIVPPLWRRSGHGVLG